MNILFFIQRKKKDVCSSFFESLLMTGGLFRLYRNAFSGLTRPIWWLSLVILINRSGTMVIPFLTLYLTQSLGYSTVQASIVMGLFGTGSIAGATMGGKLTDKLGFYPVQLLSLVCGGIAFIILGHVKSYTGICIVTFFLSMMNEAFRPANAAAIAWYSQENNRTRSYSLNRLAINVGWAVGGTMGGILASFDYTLLFWVDGLTNISAALLLWKLLSPGHLNVRTWFTNRKEKSSSGNVYRDKIYMIFIFLTTLFAICFFQVFTNLTIFYKEELHLKEFFIGMLMATNGIIIAFIEMIIVFKLEGRRHSLYYIAVGTFLVGFSYLMFNLFPSGAVLTLISMIVITIGEILSMPFMNSFWIGRSKSHNRGQYAAWYTIAYATAQIIAPVFGAFIAERYSFRNLWFVIMLICLVAAIGYYWLLQTKSRYEGK